MLMDTHVTEKYPKQLVYACLLVFLLFLLGRSFCSTLAAKKCHIQLVY
jgi:hypothetical protein